jgi:hypothetical protein
LQLLLDQGADASIPIESTLGTDYFHAETNITIETCKLKEKEPFLAVMRSGVSPNTRRSHGLNLNLIELTLLDPWLKEGIHERVDAIISLRPDQTVLDHALYTWGKKRGQVSFGEEKLLQF